MESYQQRKTSAALDFLALCGRLKVVKRQGWIRHDVRDPESSKHLSVWNESRTMEKSSPPYDTVSDHMYRMACACMLIEDDNVDKNKCIRMALVHDMGEAICGDITPYDNVSQEEKHSRECEAMDEIAAKLFICASPSTSEEVLQLWQEYTEGTSAEAQYLKDLDKFEMVLQALEYEKDQHVDLNEFYQGIDSKLKTDLVTNWFQDLVKRREFIKKQSSTSCKISHQLRENKGFLHGFLVGAGVATLAFVLNWKRRPIT